MNPVPYRCPICHQSDVIVTRLDCPGCESQITGQFELHRLNRLTPDQLRFVEIFLLNEGKINRVEQEMSLSYAAVRARLQEIVASLGGAATNLNDETHASGSQSHSRHDSPREVDRQELLARVSAGQLSAVEAAAILSGNRPSINE